ncbi:dopa decarboxylase-like protein [Decorospora gaudefroyi]|uniref:Dopa decarboxylase-like protein n=1 Tax=Decorospora gaudefroyi TaxID=184978 RepID=A0A6A5KIX3_9PLEO|nr:dopa decarboxylase-like protein [Decorospora gaudefroyi]
MDSSQFRAAAKEAIDEIATYYETLPSRPVLSTVTPGYLRPLLPESPPEEGEPWEKIQADISRVIMPGLTHWNSPKFMAFFPCNSSFPAMLGEMYSGAFNAAAFNWICSPAITELETVMMDWVAQLLALPKEFLSHGEGGGIIQGTASEVTVTALVAARERIIRRKLIDMPEGEEKIDTAADIRGKLVALGSEHAHSSTQKAALVAGTRYRSVPAPKETNYAVTASALRQTIQECRARGHEPFYFTITLGSTGTCAIDDLNGIAALAATEPNLWIHVDAAYAGSALLLPEYQHLCPPLAAFDSFNFNLHKWLLVNFDCSAFFVKRRKDLIDTYSITPSYLRNPHSEAGLVTDYRDWQIPLGRRFRSLKVWFVLRSFGAQGLRTFVRRTVALGVFFADLIKRRPDVFGLVTEPAFGLVTFQIRNLGPLGAGARANRVVPVRDALTNGFEPDADAQYAELVNQKTREVYEAVNAKGEFFLTSTVVGGQYVIRVVSATLLSEEKYMERLFDVLVKEAGGDVEQNGETC